MTSPGPNPDHLETTLTSLATAAHILDGFARRNKNQHRATAWWPAFDMLRRNLHKLVAGLEGAVQRAEIMSSSSSSAFSLAPGSGGGGGGKKKNRRRGLVAVAAARQPELDRVVERAVWVRGVLVARCYGAFTQLTADRQFAQLGLLLLGVLAQVQSALQPLIPSPAHEEEIRAAEKPAGPAAVVGSESTGAVVIPPAAGSPDSSGGPDLGVAVSRDEVSGGRDADDAKSTVEQHSPPVPRRPSMGKVSEAERGGDKHKKYKRPRTDVDSSSGTNRYEEEPRYSSPSRPPPPAATAATVEEEGVKKFKKKKKRKQGGDEFDDLFSSLI